MPPGATAAVTLRQAIDPPIAQWPPALLQGARQGYVTATGGAGGAHSSGAGCQPAGAATAVR